MEDIPLYGGAAEKPQKETRVNLPGLKIHCLAI